MPASELYQFQGVRTTEPTAAIMPPIRQEIFFGLTLEKSNAGEMKLATMLMPMVAMTKVRPPRRMTKAESMRCTVSIGSVISSPNTGTAAEGGGTVGGGKNKEVRG